MKTIIAMLLLSIGIAGCNLGHKQFRTDIEFEEDVGKCKDYSKLSQYQQRAIIQDICAKDNLLSFATIEFKDNGTFWKREQLKNVEKEIERISRAQLLAPEDRGEAILLVLYIHGWRHNASEASSDLLNFREFAYQLASSSTVCNSNANAGTCRRQQRPHVLAVYFGWRGDSTGGTSESFPPPLKQLLKIGQLATFWHRKQAARDVAGVAMTEAILTTLACIDDADRWRRDVALEQQNKKFSHHPCTIEAPPELESEASVKQYDNKVFSKSRKILIGHSFGARILELAVAQAYLGDRARSLQLYERFFGDDGEMDRDLSELRAKKKGLGKQKEAIVSQISSARDEIADLVNSHKDLLKQKTDREREYSASEERRSSAIRILKNLSNSDIVHSVQTERSCMEYDKVLAEDCAGNLIQEPFLREHELLYCIAEQMRCLYKTNLCSIEDAVLRHGVGEAEDLKADLQCGLNDDPLSEPCQGFVENKIGASVRRTLKGESDEGRSSDESTEEAVEDWVNYYCLLRRQAANRFATTDLEMGNEERGKVTSGGDTKVLLESASAKFDRFRFIGQLDDKAWWDSVTRFFSRSAVVEIKDRVARELNRAGIHMDDAVEIAHERVDNFGKVIEREDEEMASIKALVEEINEKLGDNSRRREKQKEHIGRLKDRKTALARQIEKTAGEEEALLRRIWFQKDEYLRPPADLVLLLNAASEAIVSSDLLKAMRAVGVPERARVKVPPAIVSITSETDWATRGLFPIGSRLGRLARLGPAVDPGERGLEFGTLGHQRDSFTHEVSGIAGNGPVFSIGCDEFAIVPRVRDAKDESTSEGDAASEDYWVMRVPREMIRNHGDIFVDRKGRGDCSDEGTPRGPLLGIVEGLIKYGRLFEPFCVSGPDGSCRPRTLD